MLSRPIDGWRSTSHSSAATATDVAIVDEVNRRLNRLRPHLPDGIHPNREGVAVIVEQILPSVVALIEALPQVARGENG